MELGKLIVNVIYTIFKAHVLIIVILGSTAIVEKLTPLKLFIKQYTWKKSKNNARIHLHGDCAFYFLINLGVFIYAIYKDDIMAIGESSLIWFFAMIWLMKIFVKIYKKFQGVDPTKADDDYFIE